VKTEKKILITFILNLAFAVFEYVGGILTGSVAILSDAVHDVGDALTIGISWFLERKSHKRANDRFTYGYARYSVLGSVITTVILLCGSALVLARAVWGIVNPQPINYNGMIILAIVGAGVNLFAAVLTSHGESLNQKAVNLHMLEDVLGWLVVLVGAVIMRFTGFALIDPIMSIAIAVFVIVMAIKNLKEGLNIFLEKAPEHVSVKEIKEELQEIDGVLDVHHIHLWTMDGQSIYVTMHVVTNEDAHTLKHEVREKLEEMGIGHATLELEKEGEECHHAECHTECHHGCGHHHHHHGHGHHHH